MKQYIYWNIAVEFAFYMNKYNHSTKEQIVSKSYYLYFLYVLIAVFLINPKFKSICFIGLLLCCNDNIQTFWQSVCCYVFAIVYGNHYLPRNVSYGNINYRMIKTDISVCSLLAKG
jgi:hypothetical protein